MSIWSTVGGWLGGGAAANTTPGIAGGQPGAYAPVSIDANMPNPADGPTTAPVNPAGEALKQGLLGGLSAVPQEAPAPMAAPGFRQVASADTGLLGAYNAANKVGAQFGPAKSGMGLLTGPRFNV